jgi:hypothetical protein
VFAYFIPNIINEINQFSLIQDYITCLAHDKIINVKISLYNNLNKVEYENSNIENFVLQIKHIIKLNSYDIRLNDHRMNIVELDKYKTQII